MKLMKVWGYIFINEEKLVNINRSRKNVYVVIEVMKWKVFGVSKFYFNIATNT